MTAIDKLSRLGEAIQAAKAKVFERHLHPNDRAVVFLPYTLTEELINELRRDGRVSSDDAAEEQHHEQPN